MEVWVQVFGYTERTVVCQACNKDLSRAVLLRSSDGSVEGWYGFDCAKRRVRDLNITVALAKKCEAQRRFDLRAAMKAVQRDLATHEFQDARMIMDTLRSKTCRDLREISCSG